MGGRMTHDISIIAHELETIRSTATGRTHEAASNLLRHELQIRSAFATMLKVYPHDASIEDGPQPWQVALGALLDTAATASPARAKDARAEMRQARELTREIQTLARDLARKLRARAALCDRLDLTRPIDFHPLDLIREAAWIADKHAAQPSDVAGLYRAHLARPLADLDEAFDLRHWPSTADLLDALADLQDDEAGAPMNEGLEAATTAREASIRDFWRALHLSLNDVNRRLGIADTLPQQAIVDLTAAMFDNPPGCTIENYRKCLLRSATPRGQPAQNF